MGSVRPATMADLPRAMEIYRVAQQFMVKAGNPYQWEPGFPPEEQITRDIAGQHLMVWTDESDVSQGAFAFLAGSKPDYAKICEGVWHDDGRYDVVHRFATAEQGRGLGSAMMRWALERAQSEDVAIRVDTHRDNMPMQRLIKSCGFVYCGIIHLAHSGDERLACTRTF